MTIYTKSIDHLIIQDVKNFNPTILYIKRIKRDNGSYIYYFGKTCRAKYKNYIGSGKQWLNFVQKYGRKSIEHIWFSDFYYDHIEIQYAAITFSLENNIIENEMWANCKIENGIDGGLISNETRNKISTTMTGIKRKPGQGTSGTVWINNGKEQTCIKKNMPLPINWQYGKIKNDNSAKSVVNKKIYNNGIESKYFYPEEVDLSIWVKGRLKN